MEEINLAELSDQQLLELAGKMKKSAIMHALVIGFMVGVVFYSVVESTWGLLTLIPLYFIRKLVANSDQYDEVKRLLKERNLR
ncbi:MAG: FUSC family protein [Cryomorphaceae bacterium]|nr:FUSC family protein [Cryomorphaceae bacterium]